MTSRRLKPKAIEKPWGRNDLPQHFDAGQSRIGEIWFENPTNMDYPLLVKMLYTSEKLSIQVHPDDGEARSMGFSGGKTECWYVVDAEPGAVLGIGLRRHADKEELAAAIRDGSIVDLIDWKTVKVGEFYYIPAGTIHAIGAGLTLVEIQQNNDVTYRLFDYGRPRALHVREGLAVSLCKPYDYRPLSVSNDGSHSLLTRSLAPFRVDSIIARGGTRVRVGDGPAWFITLRGKGLIDGMPWRPQECWLIENTAQIELEEDMHALLAQIR